MNTSVLLLIKRKIQLLQSENQKLREDLQEKMKMIRKLEDENLKLKDTEIKRNKEFVKIK